MNHAVDATHPVCFLDPSHGVSGYGFLRRCCLIYMFYSVSETRHLFRIGSNGGRGSLRLGEKISYACFTASYLYLYLI